MYTCRDDAQSNSVKYILNKETQYNNIIIEKEGEVSYFTQMGNILQGS